MNDNNDKVNREIEKIFSQASMNKLYENVEETSQFIKQYSGIIIASGFSMLIFLLTFIQQRTLILDIGISFLALSTILQFERYGQLSRLSTEIDEKNLILTLKRMRILTFLQIYGYMSFFLGLLFLFSHFQLFYISFSLILYLNVKFLRGIILNNRSTKKMKNNEFKSEVLSLSLSDLQMGKKFIRHFTIVLVFMIIREIVVIICSILVILNFFLLLL